MASTLPEAPILDMHLRSCFGVPVSISKKITSVLPHQGYCHKCSKDCPLRSKHSNQKHEIFRMMDLPTEIRLQIFAEICQPTRTTTYGGICHIRWVHFDSDIPTEILGLGTSAYYGSRRVVIEIPEFVKPRKVAQEESLIPSVLGKRRREPIHWPSALRIYDTENHFSLELEPFFQREHMRPQRHHTCRGLLDLDDLQMCPYYLFSGISIIVPTYHSDIEFTMNWCRLRFIGLLLSRVEECRQAHRERYVGYGINVRDGPTPMKIIFADSETWSWSDKQGVPKRRLTNDTTIAGDLIAPSDLVVMLRALAPIRKAGIITVVTPNEFPKSELDRKFSASWFMEQQTNAKPIGDDPWPIEPVFEHWLATFEILTYRYLRDIKYLSLAPSCPKELFKKQSSEYKVARRLPYLGPNHIDGKPDWDTVWQR